ncbi:MAG TPA: phage recombination protein Bet [Gaiellaceae bacterium]|nr:phage recombination protein Bet [Gaiellaceae bacterium]
MTNAIEQRKPDVAIEVAKTYTRQQVNLIKQTIMPRASDAELAVFIEYAQRTRLDPFAGQIYAIPVWDEKAKTYRYQFTTGIDGLRLVAERTGEYQGQDGPFWCGADGKWTEVWLSDAAPVAAKVVVHRLGRRPVQRVVKYGEFVQRDRQGRVRYGNWSDRPAHMLAIRAESHALRAAFPREMAGLELDDEPIHIVNPDAPASNAQKGELMRLARLFGWNDQERHDRASVESFTELTKGEAGALIDEWRTFEADLIEDGVVPEAIGGEIVEPVEPEDVDDEPAKVEAPPLFDDDAKEDVPRPVTTLIAHRYVGDGDGPCVFQIEPGTSCGWAREAHEGQGRLT